MNDCAPPKQKPTVIARSAPVSSRSVSSAVSTSRATVSGVRLLDVRHVLEVLVARAEPGRAAEVVDRDRRVPGGGEALRELLVEAEQAAHVGQDDDAGRALGAGEVGGELRAVGGRQRQLLAGRAAGDDLEARGEVGHDRVKGEAHGRRNVPLRRENHHRERRRRGPGRRGRAALVRPDRAGRRGSTASAHVSRLDDDWPQAGARRVWVTRPGGRGLISETRDRATRAGEGQTLEFEDARVRGVQRVPLRVRRRRGTRITVALDLEHQGARSRRPANGGCGASSASRCERSLRRFSYELAAERDR